MSGNASLALLLANGARAASRTLPFDGGGSTHDVHSEGIATASSGIRPGDVGDEVLRGQAEGAPQIASGLSPRADR